MGVIFLITVQTPHLTDITEALIPVTMTHLLLSLAFLGLTLNMAICDVCNQDHFFCHCANVNATLCVFCVKYLLSLIVDV